MTGKSAVADSKTIKAFVIGSPISHSLSPKLHGFWLKEYNIDGSYEAINCPLEYFVKTIKKLAATGYVGGNVTIPHKEKALMVADIVDESAKKIGAANTLVFRDGKIIASNTDAYGFTENLIAGGLDFTNVKTALVLGAGGAARAVIAALQNKNIKVTITNRTTDKAKKLATEFGCELIDWEQKDAVLSGFDLLINTTSLGMKNQPSLEIDLAKLPLHAVVHDIIYNPLKTELLEQAEQRSLKIIDGLGMLLHQAAPGFEKWFGVKPKVSQKLREHLTKCFT